MPGVVMKITKMVATIIQVMSPLFTVCSTAGAASSAGAASAAMGASAAGASAGAASTGAAIVSVASVALLSLRRRKMPNRRTFRRNKTICLELHSNGVQCIRQCLSAIAIGEAQQLCKHVDSTGDLFNLGGVPPRGRRVRVDVEDSLEHWCRASAPLGSCQHAAPNFLSRRTNASGRLTGPLASHM